MSMNSARAWLRAVRWCCRHWPASPRVAHWLRRTPGDIDQARLDAADSEPQNWFTAGRDTDGTYYSPLTSIDAGNADKLGFAWQYDLATDRGQEATPIVVDGVMYTSGTWGYVYAVDAATGRELWRYDPQMDDFCGPQSLLRPGQSRRRGLEGQGLRRLSRRRLHALDAATGRQIWDADTIADHKLPYASTGAPQIAGDVVIIGNGGADMGTCAVRGYIAAYDLATGAFKWRFCTVPPAPAAAVRESRNWRWPTRPGSAPPAAIQRRRHGLGRHGLRPETQSGLFRHGQCRALRSAAARPRTPGSLYTASIVALHADTGRMAWYYQTTPRDSWDFDAVQKFVLADLKIGGRQLPSSCRPTRTASSTCWIAATGKLLSANTYLHQLGQRTWISDSGRPVVTAEANWYAKPKTIYPSWSGAHTWNPMSYSPQTHLMYIPVIDVPAVWVDLLHNGGAVHFIDGFFTVNGVIVDDTYDAAELKRLYGPLPDLASIKAARHGKPMRELLRALDPLIGRTRPGRWKPHRASAVTTAAFSPPRAISCSRAAAAASCGCMPPTAARCWQSSDRRATFSPRR